VTVANRVTVGLESDKVLITNISCDSLFGRIADNTEEWSNLIECPAAKSPL
jgi:hypothetical protein